MGLWKQSRKCGRGADRFVGEIYLCSGRSVYRKGKVITLVRGDCQQDYFLPIFCHAPSVCIADVCLFVCLMSVSVCLSAFFCLYLFACMSSVYLSVPYIITCLSCLVFLIQCSEWSAFFLFAMVFPSSLYHFSSFHSPQSHATLQSHDSHTALPRTYFA